MKRLIAIVLLGLSIVLANAQSVTENLVTNPNFTSMSGWTATGHGSNTSHPVGGPGQYSFGTRVDYNCERLKLSKTLYDMGMKVAAVATMCQDRRVFDAMMNAGTPCPIDGKIGAEAKLIWDAEPARIPPSVNEK